MRIQEFLNEVAHQQGVAEDTENRCQQCGMKNCKCPGDTCKCKPIAGWVPGKGFAKAREEAALNEKWSQKYKSSINCSHPKGFSQKAHCAGKKKHNESAEMEMVCEDCGMCQTHGSLNEIKKGQKDSNGYTRCWPGKHAEGTKKGKNGGQVRNCVPNESQGVAEGSRNAYLKHNNLVDIEKPLAGLKSEFEKFLQTHDPEEKQKYQQGIKQRIKSEPMSGPKGVLPEQGVAEGSEDRSRFIRHNIWTVMDSDEEVMQHAVEGDPFFSAKKFIRDLDDQGYEFTHVISPEGQITYLPQHDPRHLRNFPDQGVAEGEGNFAGDTPVNIGGATVKRLGVGDTVTYFGRRAKIIGMSKTGNTSRIAIANDMGGITQDVLTSDLKRASQ